MEGSITSTNVAPANQAECYVQLDFTLSVRDQIEREMRWGYEARRQRGS